MTRFCASTMDHGPAHHCHIPRRLQPKVPPPPSHGVAPALHIGDPSPPLQKRPAPPPFIGDTHPYIDDVPLFVLEEFDGDVKEDVQALPLQVAAPIVINFIVNGRIDSSWRF